MLPSVLALLIIASPLSFAVTLNNMCNVILSTNITTGKKIGEGVILFGGISYTPNLYFKHSGQARGCICKLRPCIRKCCPYKDAVINGTCQENIFRDDFKVDVFDYTEYVGRVGNEHFHFIYNRECRNGFYRLSPIDYSEDEAFIQENGRLYMSYGAKGRRWMNPDEFCVDFFVDGNNGTDLVMENAILACFPDDTLRYFRYGMIISMPFLLVTFIVYAILPDRNLHGKALMCYVIALLGAYVLLVYIQLNPDTLDLLPCQSVGIVCLFFFMVSFFWMNVMSFDIWWAFSGLRGFSGSKAEAERKRFLLYCGYAWGVPLLLAILIAWLTLNASLPQYAWYNPGMGTGQCWLREGVPTLVYFYGPMALLILANVGLFATTAWKIKRVQRDTAMLRKDESKKHSYENDKQRFNLYLKLMLAMGVNWSMEIISWAIDWQVGTIPPPVWYVTDFCNALYGVFIFFIFVFKRNILKLLKRRYYMCLGKPHLARTMTQNTYSPRTTTMSQISNTEKTFVNDSSILTSEVA